jgi:hypothetical protein
MTYRAERLPGGSVEAAWEFGWTDSRGKPTKRSNVLFAAVEKITGSRSEKDKVGLTNIVDQFILETQLDASAALFSGVESRIHKLENYARILFHLLAEGPTDDASHFVETALTEYLRAHGYSIAETVNVVGALHRATLHANRSLAEADAENKAELAWPTFIRNLASWWTAAIGKRPTASGEIRKTASPFVRFAFAIQMQLPPTFRTRIAPGDVDEDNPMPTSAFNTAVVKVIGELKRSR